MPKAIAVFDADDSNENKQASADLLTPAFDKAGNRMRKTFENIGTALSDGFTKGSSLIDTSDWESQLDASIGGVMDRVQKVSEQACADVDPKKPTGAQLNLDDGEDKPQKTVKNAVSAIQRIGGGGAAYSNGDPMLREQQRQTRELTTQTDGMQFITVPTPKVGIVADGPNVAVKWPAAAVGWVLESSVTLAPTSWQPVTMAGVTVDRGVATMLQPVVGPQKFYRLRRIP